MSNYTITTDFGAKDSLPSSNSAKVVRGSEFTTEFTNIQTAIATKADTAGDTFTGAVTFDAAVTLNSTATITGDLTVDTDTLFVDVSADKVGIGTSSPDTLLEVVGADPILTIRDSETSSGATSATLRLAESGGGDTLGNYWDIKHNPNAELSVLAGTAERMRIDSSGNVGIGETNPSAKLHIDSGATDEVLRLEGTGSPYLSFYDTGVRQSYIGSIGNTLQIYGDTPDTNIAFYTAGTQRATIDSSGNVGIGTTSPATALHIDSSGATALTLQRNSGASSNISIKYDGASQDYYTGVASVSEDFVIGTSADLNGNNLLRVTSAGNVGIGTTNPTALLHLESASAPTLKIDDSDSTLALELSQDGADGSMLLKSAGTLSIGVTNNSASDTVSFQTQSTERMRITSTGNVGIGTTSPDNTLVVQGASTTGASSTGNVALFEGPSGTNGLKIFVDDTENAAGLQTISADDLLLNPHGGNVGIGTTSPATALHIDSSGATALTLQRNSGASSNISIKYDGASQDYYTGVASVSEDFVIGTSADLNGNNLLRVTSAGNVGIGTTSFTSKFHVGGNMTDYVYSEPAGDSIATFAPTTTGTSSAMNVNIGSGMYGGAGVETARLNFLNGHGNDGFATGFSIKSYKTASATATDEYLAFEEIRRAGNTSVTHNERMRIDSSGNLLVGKTSDLISSVGGTIGAAGYITATRDGSAPLSANRLTSDGALVNLYKDGSTVGSVGVSGSRPYLSNGVNDGIKIADDYVAPCNQTGADKDASLDLGSSSARFKDLHLSGGVHLGGTGTANKLDDYEEGTWTPVLEDISGNTTTWAGTVEGYYTKIGNTVNAWYIFSSSDTAITNRAYTIIRGLPFAQSLGERASVATVSRVFGLTMSDSNYYSGVSGTAIDFLDLDSGNSRITFTPTGNQQRFTGGVTYRTS